MLQAVGREADSDAVREEQIAIGADQMRHRRLEPDVTVQPEAAVHRVTHPLAT
jgi:hypothetical protein